MSAQIARAIELETELVPLCLCGCTVQLAGRVLRELHLVVPYHLVRSERTVLAGAGRQ